MTDVDRLILPMDDLPSTAHARELEGADHGDVPFSIILVDAPHGAGPAVHRHAYAEVFVVEEGTATFTLGEEARDVRAGHVVIGPPNVAHGFKNTGDGRLRVVAIHGASRFETEWLEAADETWRSKPGPAGSPAPE